MTPVKAKVVCGWCGTVLRTGSEPASDGICHPCLLGQLSKDDGAYLSLALTARLGS